MSWLTTALARFWGSAGMLFAKTMNSLREQGAFDRAVELATTTVAKLAGDDSKDNEAKRLAAIDAIARVLAREGKTVRDSLIALAVELAVNAAKARTGAH